MLLTWDVHFSIHGLVFEAHFCEMMWGTNWDTKAPERLYLQWDWVCVSYNSLLKQFSVIYRYLSYIDIYLSTIISCLFFYNYKERYWSFIGEQIFIAIINIICDKVFCVANVLLFPFINIRWVGVKTSCFYRTVKDIRDDAVKNK